MKLCRTIREICLLNKYFPRAVSLILIYQKALRGCIKISRCIDKISFRRQIAMICILWRISTSVYLTKIQPDILLEPRKVKYLDRLQSHRRPHARGFLSRENRWFSRDSPATTQSEGKKHCSSFVVSSGTCSSPPRQQLINRSALPWGKTHRAASLSLWMAFRTDYFSFTVIRSRPSWGI